MTAVDYLIEQLQAPCRGIPSHIIEQAKKMEKQQIINAHISGYDSSGESAEDYYQYYYGSKGSDETKVVEFDHLKKEITSSQTEISDEEIEEASNKAYWVKGGFMKGAKWYREQLKKK